MKTTDFRPKKLIALEGNVGAGKSTMQKILCQELGACLIPEPTAKWQSVNEHENILNMFYKDTKRWAYTFQTFTVLTRLQAIWEHQTDSNTLHIIDRSVFGDGFCFAKNCYESGLMTPLEWHIYQEWFYWLVENYAPRPSGFIYLRTSPEVSYQRLAKRNSSEESGTPLDYFKSLHQKHDEWLLHRQEPLQFLKKVPVLILECDKDFLYDQEELAHHVKRVREFINDLKAPTENHNSTYTQAAL